MNIINKKKNERFKVMEKIYIITEGIEHYQLQFLDLAKALAFDDDDSCRSLINILNYLASEKLIKVDRMQGGIPATIFIVHKGVVEVEKALSSSSNETEHFKPIVTITNNIGSMVDSILQQATVNSTQSVNYLDSEGKDDLNKLLQNLTNELSEILSKFTNEQQQDIHAELSTIKSQLKSSKPKNSVIFSSLETLMEVLKGAAGSGVWELISAMSRVIETA